MNKRDMETLWKVKKICETENINTSEIAGVLSIELKPDMHTSVEVFSRKCPCVEKAYYKLHLEMDAGECGKKCIIHWFGENGRSILRAYVTDGDEILSPTDAVEAEIAILLYSKVPAKAVIKGFQINYERPYKKKEITVAAVHIGPYSSEQSKTLTVDRIISEHLKRIDDVVEEQHPDLVLLGEHFHNTSIPGTLIEKSITMDGDIIRVMKEKAKEKGIYLAFSIHRKDENNHVYATAVLIDRNGAIVGVYDKTHLTTTEFEAGIVPGNEIPVFDTELGKIGFIICWDMWFPGISQVLYKKGVQLILNPTAGYPDEQTNAVAYLTGAYIVCASSHNANVTRIISNSGEVIDRGKGKGYAVATVDIERPNIQRGLSVGSGGIGKNIYINEWRPDLYEF